MRLRVLPLSSSLILKKYLYASFSFSYWKYSCALSIFSVVFAHAHVVLLTTQKSRRAEKNFIMPGKRKWRDREGSSGRWPGYVMSTKVIFYPAEVSFFWQKSVFRHVIHAVLPRSQVLSDSSSAITWNLCFSFKHQIEVCLHADVSEDRLPLGQRLPLV